MTDSMVKKMTVEEFRELGLLQELNRRFLHPMGLALEVVIEKGRPVRFGEVWDYRDDKEGMALGDDMDPKAAKYVDELVQEHEAARVKMFGQIIQPVNPATRSEADGGTE